MRIQMTSDKQLAENLEAVLTTLLLDVNLPGIYAIPAGSGTAAPSRARQLREAAMNR